MMLLVLSVVLSFVSLHHSALAENSPNLQLDRYETEIKIISSLLARDCPDYVQQKRELTDLEKLNLELKASYLQDLKERLLKCRKGEIASTTINKNTDSGAKLSTTPTPSSVPAECLTATNLTQSWRLDHNGKNIKGGGPHSTSGYACDLRRDLGWFRFSGAAGTHMLNKCPKYRSCGTLNPHWTDDKAPQAVGVTADISTYQIFNGNCRAFTHSLQVMRCSLSTDHDLIYRYTGPFYPAGLCFHAFCGMN